MPKMHTHAPNRPGLRRARFWHRLSPEDKAARRALVVGKLRDLGPSTAVEVAGALGWSSVAVRLLLTELLADGCVLRGGSRPRFWSVRA